MDLYGAWALVIGPRVSYSSTSFLFSGRCYSVCCVGRSSVDGGLDRYHFGAAVNDAATSSPVQVFCVRRCQLSEYVFRSGTAGSQHNC